MKLQSPSSNLNDFFQDFSTAVMQPLKKNDGMKPVLPDGVCKIRWARKTIKSKGHIKPEARLEIYNQQYWYRVLGCFYDDFPGVRLLLGDKRFEKIAQNYLTQYPSQSFTLRNLGNRFATFLKRQTFPSKSLKQAMVDMARLEWEQIEAFDAVESAPLQIQKSLDWSHTKIILQPHVRLLKLRFPVDEWLVEYKGSENQVGSSNAAQLRRKKRTQLAKRMHLKAKSVCLAVHRHDERVWLKRLEPQAFAILEAFEKGTTLERAFEKAMKGKRGLDPSKIQSWFQEWSALKWLVLLTP